MESAILYFWALGIPWNKVSKMFVIGPGYPLVVLLNLNYLRHLRVPHDVGAHWVPIFSLTRLHFSFLSGAPQKVYQGVAQK